MQFKVAVRDLIISNYWGKPEQASHKFVVAVRCTSVACPRIYITHAEIPTLGGQCVHCTSIVCPRIYVTDTESPTLHDSNKQDKRIGQDYKNKRMKNTKQKKTLYVTITA